MSLGLLYSMCFYFFVWVRIKLFLLSCIIVYVHAYYIVIMWWDWPGEIESYLIVLIQCFDIVGSFDM